MLYREIHIGTNSTKKMEDEPIQRIFPATKVQHSIDQAQRNASTVQNRKGHFIHLICSECPPKKPRTTIPRKTKSNKTTSSTKKSFPLEAGHKQMMITQKYISVKTAAITGEMVCVEVLRRNFRMRIHQIQID